MIKVEHIETFNWHGAIRGMRNPLDSHAKSDTIFDQYGFILGENDLALARKLCRAGSDHRKFLRQIMVSMDIAAPLYWWPEWDAYKVGTVANSCSKMHTLLNKPFEMEDFSFEKLPGYRREVKQFRPHVDEMCELWVAYDEDYAVSDAGRIRRRGRMLSGSLHQDGYIFVTLHGKQIPLHRIIAEVFCPNIDKKPEVNHKDGNKQNNAVGNLEWVTRAENQKHAVDMCLQPKAVSKYTGKFSQEQRDEIKREWDEGSASIRQMAKKYGVSHTCICDIVNDRYKYAERTNLFEDVARPIVDTLNELRDAWIRCDTDEGKRAIWYSILQILPEGYNQKRTVTLNYEVLLNMYHARRNHRLDEWRTFCEVIETMPYFAEICLEEK